MTAPAGGPGSAAGRLHRLWEGLRPLDPIRSIKMKFAVLLAAAAVGTGLLELYGFIILGWRPAYSLALAVVFSLAFSQVIAHGMTAPLRQMTSAAKELAQGRVASPVRTSSRDEVGELARAFTAMSGKLAAADAQRRELLANVGHELRTPVAALRAQLENLADGVRPADPPALDEVLGQVERLGDLLTDLLDLARAEGGAVPLERRPVPIRPLVDGVVAQVLAARPGRSIEIRVEPPGLIADADPYRLGQVLTNLVDNATRHAGDGGRVEILAHGLTQGLAPGPAGGLDRAASGAVGSGPAGAGAGAGAAGSGAVGGLMLQVTDDGPGIPPERWETVFERFRGGTGEIAVIQPDAARGGAGAGPVVGAGPAVSAGAEAGAGANKGRDGGTGLGLAIARWAVVLHGGTIAVVPVESGGCRIRVEIPSTQPV